MNIQDLEKKYPVDKIKVNGIHLWPYIRIYLGDHLLVNQNRQVKASGSNIKKILLSLPFGFRKIFKRYDILMFSSASQRRLMNGKMTDRLDLIVPKGLKSLILESPIPKHHKRNVLFSDNVSSKSRWLLKERIIMKFLKANIEGETIIKDILDEENISFNYRNLAKRLIAQKRIMDRFLKRNKIKAFILITPYINMGYVYSAKCKGIPVIELQHGVINTEHFAYNLSGNIDPQMYPDYLLTWGENVLSIFGDSNEFLPRNRVIPTGHFYIDYINTEYKGDDNLRKKLAGYKKTIAFTAQDIFEPLSTPFLREFARSNPDIGLVYIPRDKKQVDYKKENFPTNIIFADELNCYEIIYHCDFHSTINSSCAIEALCMGKRNILIDIDNLATKYYKTMLNTEDTIYARSVNEFADFVKKLDTPDKQYLYNKYSGLITPGFKNNANKLINKLLNV